VFFGTGLANKGQTKNMKTSILTLAFIAIAFTSCTKTMDMPAAPVPSTISTSATTLNELNAPENFDWSTTKKINFIFDGKDAESYSLLLKVSDNEGNVIMQKMQNSDQSFQMTLNIPANYTSLTVAYGATEKNIDCTAGSATMTIN
jgi:hypothetical protein